jgi:hypothetical protein
MSGQLNALEPPSSAYGRIFIEKEASTRFDSFISADRRKLPQG